jgi:hypothetical protein
MTNTALASKPGLVDRLVDAIEADPRKTFIVFLLFHVVLWTAIPSLICRNLPLDVIEGIAHGRDFELGYWKHPPLAWWMDDAVRRIAGNFLPAYFLLGQLTVALCFWALWRFGCEFLRPLDALVALVLLDGIRLFNAMTVEFNHNVLQLPIWALAGWATYRAFVGSRLADWAWVGLWFAVAIYAKYSAATLIATLLIFAVVDSHARRCWRTPGPYVAMLICAALVLPNVLWLFAHDFSPFEFARSKSKVITEWTNFFRVYGKFVGSVLAQIGVVILLFALIKGRDWRIGPKSAPPDDFTRRYIIAIGLGPFVLTVASALVGLRELHTGWIWQFWVFLGLMLMAVWRVVVDRQALKRFFVGWSVVTLVTVVATVLGQAFHLGGGARWATQFPGDKFAAAVMEEWRKETDKPLGYVVGDFWLAGNVILNVPNPPRLLQDGDPYFNPGIDLNDVRRRGAMLLWTDPFAVDEIPEPMRKRFADARLNAPLVIQGKTPRGDKVWRFGWAVLPPKPDGSTPP